MIYNDLNESFNEQHVSLRSCRSEPSSSLFKAKCATCSSSSVDLFSMNYFLLRFTPTDTELSDPRTSTSTVCAAVGSAHSNHASNRRAPRCCCRNIKRKKKKSVFLPQNNALLFPLSAHVVGCCELETLTAFIQNSSII